jgi:hypothetical protein
LSFSISDIFQARGHFFNRFFSMDSLLDLVKNFEIDQPGYLVVLGETLGDLELISATRRTK